MNNIPRASASPRTSEGNGRTQVHLPLVRQSAAQARAFVGGYAREMGFAPDALADIELAVGEAVTNAILYTGPLLSPDTSSAGTFTVVVERTSCCLVVEVEDEGAGFDPAAVRRTAVGDGDALSGRGLLLMQALMDRVDVLRRDPVGTTVRMERHLASAP